ncbi:MAG: hypothetical protein M4D85_10490 [Actinomycetota bacterium]|nr:hypothetical protein [Actinomycetota bacterium]
MTEREPTGDRRRRRAVGPPGSRPAEPRPAAPAAQVGDRAAQPDDRPDEHPDDDEERLRRDVPPHHGT